jgi:hypothetical protein
MTGRIALYIAAAALIAAHFLRAGSVIGVTLCLAGPMLFLVRSRWSLLVLEWLIYGAAVAWLATAWQLVAMRQSLGQPWHLGAAVLVAVAAVSVLAGGLLHGKIPRERYRDR